MQHWRKKAGLNHTQITGFMTVILAVWPFSVKIFQSITHVGAGGAITNKTVSSFQPC